MRLKAIQGRGDMMRFTFLVSHNNSFFQDSRQIPPVRLRPQIAANVVSSLDRTQSKTDTQPLTEIQPPSFSARNHTSSTQ